MKGRMYAMRTDNALTREVLSMTNIGRQDKTCSTKRFHAACYKCRPSTLFPLFFCFSLCGAFSPRYEHVRVTRAACITWYANRRKRGNLARYTLLYNTFVMYLYVFGEVRKKISLRWRCQLHSRCCDSYTAMTARFSMIYRDILDWNKSSKRYELQNLSSYMFVKNE